MGYYERMKKTACSMIVLTLFALLVVAGSGETDYRAAAGMIRLRDDPAIETKYGAQDWYNQLKTWVTTGKNWEEALKTIDERIALSRPQGVETVVTWDDTINSPTAYGGTRDGRGFMKVEPEFLKMIPQGQWETALKCTFAHEYTHVLQRTIAPKAAAGWPEWYREGMAIYAGGDGIIMNSIALYRSSDLVALEQSDKKPHPRGTMVFLHLKEKFGMEKIKELVNLTVARSRPLEESFAKISGMSWAQFKQNEQVWSLEYLRKREKK